MSLEAAAADSVRQREVALLRGRVDIVYTLGQHFLFLPFAALCMAATLIRDEGTPWVVALPLVLLIFASVASNRLKTGFDESDRKGDPLIWARRFAILSGVTGAIWGFGAVIWFEPNEFPAQAFLVLAFLGMTATEFVARGVYRPAYVAHATASLLPLIVLLFLYGGVYAQLTVVLILLFAGVLYNYCGTVGDLIDESIRLRHDKALLITTLSAEKAIAESSRDLAHASERSKSAFIASISHEVRTPLNAILGMAQLLERAELEKAQRDHVNVLLEAGRGLKILLDDIIALAVQGDEAVDPQTMPEDGCDAGLAARTVSRLLQPNAWEKQLRLSVNISPGLPHAAADPRILRRVLLKLAGNAIKFTERGSIEILVDPEIDEAGKAHIRFRVIDTGPGVPSHLATKIFLPFAKADDSYARRHNGAGVGLAVAKRLVESLRGDIGVDSEPGAGATFWFTVPALAMEVIGALDPSENATAPSGLSILCFVGNSELATSLEHVLAPFGNHVAFAENLQAAARLCGRRKFSLIITEGEYADGLAAMPGHHTPILALARPDERRSSGAEHTLRWPTNTNALYEAIAATVGTSDATKIAQDEERAEAAIDAKVFADLEKSLGLKTLIDILQSYMATAEEQAKALDTALTAQEWPQAARLAQDIAGAAGGLGLTALTSAARLLAQAVRDGGLPPFWGKRRRTCFPSITAPAMR